MVFGIGEGKVDIVLEKLNYSPGETIKGTVKLQLNSPKKAKELRVRFWGERNVRTTSRTFDSASHKSVERPTTRKDIVYEFKLTLDGEKEYTGGEYQFEIAVPKIPEPPKLEGTAAMLVGIAESLGAAPSPVRWYMNAILDLPMSFDINKTVQINVV